MTRLPENDALELLRALFDLAQADVYPTRDLLERLLGHDGMRASALLAQLRRAGFVQRDRLGLTMAGLVVATGMPPLQPKPMADPGRAAPLCAA